MPKCQRCQKSQNGQNAKMPKKDAKTRKLLKAIYYLPFHTLVKKVFLLLTVRNDDELKKNRYVFTNIPLKQKLNIV